MRGYAWGAAECSNACLFTQKPQHSPAEADLPLIFNHEGASEVLLLPPLAHGSLDTIGVSSSLTDKMTRFSG